MGNCSCCGFQISNSQSVCSMCYGDIDYGYDGYYKQWAEEQMLKQENMEYEEMLSVNDNIESF